MQHMKESTKLPLMAKLTDVTLLIGMLFAYSVFALPQKLQGAESSIRA